MARVTKPLEINDTRLISSTAAEPGPGEAFWNAATNYATGSTVIRPNHRKYERLAPGGVDATTPESDPLKWTDVGASNQYAMFDLLRNTGTTAPSPLVVEIEPGQRIDALAALGMAADSMRIQATTDGGATWIYDQTILLKSRVVTNWKEYFFAPFLQTPSVARFDLPLSTGARFKITFTRAAGDVTVGALILGMSTFLGDAEVGAVSDVLNFSIIERDADGNSILKPRRSVPTASLEVWTDKTQVRGLMQLRTELNAVPALWSGLDDATDGYFEPLLILGVYKRWTFSLDHHTQAIQRIDVEES